MRKGAPAPFVRPNPVDLLVLSLHYIWRRLQPCSVKEVTIGFEAGKGKEKDVSIAPPNSKTGDMGGPGPGHAAFCDARLAE